MVDFETVRLDVNSMLPESAAPAVHVTVFHAAGASSAALKDGNVLEIGRAPTCDLIVPDESLSRHHARLRLVDGQLYVEDLGSTNGTKVGDRAVREETPVHLADLVTFGSVTARFATHRGASSALASQVDGYDHFRQHVTDEVARARHFGRSAAVLALRALHQPAPALVLVPQVNALLRPIDRIALHSKAIFLVLLPEADEPHAVQVARALTDATIAPRLVCGVAVFPPHGGTVDEILEQATDQLQRATAAALVQLPRSGARTLAPAPGARVVASPSMVVHHRRAAAPFEHPGAAARRDRRRQGGDRARAPRRRAAGPGTAGVAQLRRHREHAGGEHAVWPREGRVHRRRQAAQGRVRGG
jgi:predicted component of type VI protein secretion system